MSLPINGQSVGVVYQPLSYEGIFNESITVKGQEEESFDTPEAAQERADQVAQAEDIDAAVIQGDDGKYYVIHVDEVRNLEPEDNAVQGQFRLHQSDPNVVSFSVSRQGNPSQIQRIRPESGVEEMTQKNAILTENGYSLNDLNPVVESLFMQLSAEDLSSVMNDYGDQLEAIADNPLQQETFQAIFNGEVSSLEETFHTLDMMKQTFDGIPEEFHGTISEGMRQQLSGSPAHNLAQLQEVILTTFLQIPGIAGQEHSSSSDEIQATATYLSEIQGRGADVDYGELLHLVEAQTTNGHNGEDVLAAVQAYGVIQDSLQSLNGQFPGNYQRHLEDVRDKLVEGNVHVDDETADESIEENVSVYRHQHNTVYQRDFSIDNPRERAVLLHELIHGSQDDMGQMMLKELAELDAYLVQGLYLIENGEGGDDALTEYAQAHLDHMSGEGTRADYEAAREVWKEALENSPIYAETLSKPISFNHHSHGD